MKCECGMELTIDPNDHSNIYCPACSAGNQPECKQHTLRTNNKGDYQCVICGIIISTRHGYRWPEDYTKTEYEANAYCWVSHDTYHLFKAGYKTSKQPAQAEIDRYESLLEANEDLVKEHELCQISDEETIINLGSELTKANTLRDEAIDKYSSLTDKYCNLVDQNIELKEKSRELECCGNCSKQQKCSCNNGTYSCNKWKPKPKT